MTATTTEAPTIRQAPEYAHPKWCRTPHPDGEHHQSKAFDVESDGRMFLASIVQNDGDEPRVVLEVRAGKGDRPKIGDYGFTFAQAFALADALLELQCLASVCECDGDYLCPGSPDYVEQP